MKECEKINWEKKNFFYLHDKKLLCVILCSGSILLLGNVEKLGEWVRLSVKFLSLMLSESALSFSIRLSILRFEWKKIFYRWNSTRSFGTISIHGNGIRNKAFCGKQHILHANLERVSFLALFLVRRIKKEEEIHLAGKGMKKKCFMESELIRQMSVVN